MGAFNGKMDTYAANRLSKNNGFAQPSWKKEYC